MLAGDLQKLNWFIPVLVILDKFIELCKKIARLMHINPMNNRIEFCVLNLKNGSFRPGTFLCNILYLYRFA